MLIQPYPGELWLFAGVRTSLHSDRKQTSVSCVSGNVWGGTMNPGQGAEGAVFEGSGFAAATYYWPRGPGKMTKPL